MQWLLSEIFLLVKNIERGFYKEEPFDRNSTSFAMRETYKPREFNTDDETDLNESKTKECSLLN